MSLRTRLTDLLGIQYPIVQAGMGQETNAQMVAATSRRIEAVLQEMVHEAEEAIRQLSSLITEDVPKTRGGR